MVQMPSAFVTLASVVQIRTTRIYDHHNDHRTASLVTCKVHEAKEDQRRDAKPIIIIYKAEAAHVPLPSFILVNLRFCQALCQITLLFCHHIPDAFVSYSMFYFCQNLLRAHPHQSVGQEKMFFVSNRQTTEVG